MYAIRSYYGAHTRSGAGRCGRGSLGPPFVRELGAAAACAGLLVIGLGYSQPLDAQAASIEVFNALALFVLMGVFASHMARGIRNANQQIAELAGRVITSYSIHYTKLYELTRSMLWHS